MKLFDYNYEELKNIMETETLLQELSASTSLLINQFSNVDLKIFNVKPSENVWSAGNIAEHIIILESYINRILLGKVVNTERDPLKVVELIKSYFLDFDKKLTAPEPIAPKKIIIEKDFVLDEFRKNRNSLIDKVNSNDMTFTCLDFSHKLFGELTRAEWIYFIIYHTERHLYQLSKIMKVLKPE